MYISDELKIQWWFPLHVGSTVTRFLLEKLGFTGHWGQHPIDPNCDYDIFVNIRNPYTLTISSWKFNQYRLSGMSFSDFVQTYKGEYPFYPNLSQIDYVEHSKLRKTKVKKIIRQETLYEDLMSIDFIQRNYDILQDNLEKIEKIKTFKRSEYFQNLYLNEIYSEELANIVYENRKKFFDFGGYDKDSWKTLKY